MRRSNNALLLWLGYCSFVVYGSLVPLDFRPMPLDVAWRTFQHAPLLAIGAEHRADWISNIVLFVPVGFLSAHGLLQTWPRGPRMPLLLLAGGFCFGLAGAIEFTQLFFPPRTVALNDLFAEAVGSLLGLAIAARYSAWFAGVMRSGLVATRRIDTRWLALYGFCYVALSLFPYDFVLSVAELESKVDSSSWGWALARPSHGVAVGLLKLAAELLSVMPIGWWLAATSRRPLKPSAAAAFGALLGLAIELTQFFMLSGVSQGLSVLSRVAGVALGAHLWRQRAQWSMSRLAAMMRRHLPWLTVLYALLLLQANHWVSAGWQGSATAARQLHELRFLPFYYHYYTTEMAALASLVAAMLLYAPIGAGVWAARQGGPLAAGLALLSGAVIEAGKLFIPRGHPDPTNVLIAVGAAWGAHAFLTALERGARSSMTAEGQTTAHATVGDATVRTASMPRMAAPRVALWLIALALACWGVADFPVQPGLIGALLAAAAIAVWLRPAVAFLIVPAALPVLDLAGWSGRIVVDEFDLLVLLTFATAWLRTPARPAAMHAAWQRTVTIVVGLALAIGVARGALPWQGSGDLAFESLHGPLNALRIGKGALWAWLGCALWRRMAASGERPWRWLELGVASGLAMTVAVIVWERVTFMSLFDFASSYRVTGPFSAMHVGGAYIEAFLVVALPFLLLLILEARHALSRIAGAALLVTSVYAVMVTFSRSGYAALAVATVVMLGAFLLRSGGRAQTFAWAGVLAVLMLLVAVPVLRGAFVQERADAAEGDFALRVNHWRDGIAMRPSDAVTQLIGNGLGRFPETHYWTHDAQHRAGDFHVHRDTAQPFLRLGSGDAIYVEQFVPIAPQRDYVLRLQARSNLANAETNVSLCEKSLLTSFDCVRATLNAGPVANQWHAVEVKFNSGLLGGRPWYSSRPVKLSLQNPKQALAFDVSGLRLLDSQGHSLLLNGDFSQAMDHWFFAADNHLPWHAKSLPIALWFDLGWLGVAAFALLFSTAMLRAARGTRRGSLHAAAPLAALSGFMVLGVFDSLIDTPRFLMLCLALCALCCADPRSSQPEGGLHG